MAMTGRRAHGTSTRKSAGALALLLAALALAAGVAQVEGRKIIPGPGSTPKPASKTAESGGDDVKASDGGAAAETETVDPTGKYGFDDGEDWRHDYDDAYGSFNVSARLEAIFPLMDLDHDGHIDKAELKRWHLEQGKNSSKRRADHEFEASDNDKDGYVTLAEYLQDEFEAHVDASEGDDLDHMEDYNKKWIRNTRITFNLSDTNHDGRLNADEFYTFLHPEESGLDTKLVEHLIKQDVREHDTNRDGKLNFTEFFEGLYNELEEHGVEGVYDEESGAAGEEDPLGDAYEKKREAKARAMFAELDTDKDGAMTAEELRASRAAVKKLHPTEEDHASDQADHLVGEADGNKDGKLTLTEMLSNHMVFYSTAMNDEDGYPYHDEF